MLVFFWLAYPVNLFSPLFLTSPTCQYTKCQYRYISSLRRSGRWPLRLLDESCRGIRGERNERKKVGGLADHQLETAILCSERFARSGKLLDRLGRYARMIVEYNIGLADLLENHNTPPNSFLDSNFRDKTSFFRVLPSPR